MHRCRAWENICRYGSRFNSPQITGLPSGKLGLCIGLEAMDKLLLMMAENPDRFGRNILLAPRCSPCGAMESLIETIKCFWLDHGHRMVRSMDGTSGYQ